MMKIILAVLTLILFSSIDAAAQKTTDCANMTDEQIVKSIYDKLKKKKKYDEQLMHLNVVSRDGVVTLQGWTTTKKIKAEIVKLVEKMKCVKAGVVNQLGDAPLGCGPGQKKCGSICIGLEEVCNICTAKTCL
jgi:osmotically-inducible protein OsmY